jgi:formylglycine-generating enzyme required for sulfatase activity
MRRIAWIVVSAMAALLAAAVALAQDAALTVPVLPDKADPAARAEPVQLYTHSFALVIGIDKYQSRGWPKLSNGVRDAEEVAKALARHGFTVTLKKDVTSAELEAQLRDFFIRVGAERNARLLLWFAGHGHTVDGEGYLVPADAPASSAGAAFHLKALSLRRFAEYMREAKSKHVLAVFDSCFGGTVFDTARARPPTFIRRATTLPVRQMISSGEADQEVSDNGMFRKLFIAALDGEEPAADANRDGFLTASELGLFLSDKVTNLMVDKARKPLQTPRWGKLRLLGYDRGDFVFRVGGAEKVAVATPPKDARPPRSEAAEAWSVAKGEDTIPALEAYIRRFRETYYGDLAKARLADLKRAEAARRDAEAKKERERLALLQKQREEEKMHSEARRKAEQEAAKKKAQEDVHAAAEAERICTDVKGISDLALLNVRAGQWMGTPAAGCISARIAQLEQAARKKAEEEARRDPALRVKPGSGRSFRDCPDVCPEMVVVPAGSFTMGSPGGEDGRSDSEGPQGRVTIVQPFAVGKFEVTRGEFETFARESGHAIGDKCDIFDGDQWQERAARSFRNPGFAQDARHPAVCVNWEDASAFVGWLSRKTGKTYRLLSEAEWEYAARAGTTTPFWWGASISTNQANYRGNYTYGGGAKGEYRRKTVPVDSFAKNPWGLYNVHGNVMEWVQDCWNGNYNGAPSDGSAWTAGDCGTRMMRGGSWIYAPSLLRSAYRTRNPPAIRTNDVGFRVARTL